MRLFYVAVTRAKNQLIISANLPLEEEEPAPPKASLLGLLWPHVDKNKIALIKNELSTNCLEKDNIIGMLTRLQSSAFDSKPIEIKAATIAKQAPWHFEDDI